jgi:undecaprenyl-diphosphatase
VAGHFTPLIPHAPDNGFPSDHTLLSSAIAMTVFLRNRSIGGLLWFLTLLVAAGRIGSGLHSPIDVAGSIAFSIIAGVIAEILVRRIFGSLRKQEH